MLCTILVILLVLWLLGLIGGVGGGLIHLLLVIALVVFVINLLTANPPEYYDIARNDEKARLDNFAIRLQQEPGSQGYVIIYPGRKAGPSQAQARSQRIVDYLVTTRGVDAHRVVVTLGPARESWVTELWVVPEGAPAPVPQR